ncbi:MAG: ankyrin repeat domain-containing protein [Gemmataceae bacterium]
MAEHDLAEALVRAASNTNLARVRELLARGAEPNTPAEFGRTPLPVAVRYAHNNETDAILIVEALLAAGADINASPGDCLAPVRYAAIHGYKDLLRFLISKGADPNDRDPNGQTVIAMIESTPSLNVGSKRIVKILEQAGGVRS